jgi:hypothetical protein
MLLPVLGQQLFDTLDIGSFVHSVLQVPQAWDITRK